MERLSHPNWWKVIAVSQLHRKFNRCVPASKRRETRKSLAASIQGNLLGKLAGSEGKKKVGRNKPTPGTNYSHRRLRRRRRCSRRHCTRGSRFINHKIYICSFISADLRYLRNLLITQINICNVTSHPPTTLLDKTEEN